jgi:hypothetical protein
MGVPRKKKMFFPRVIGARHHSRMNEVEIPECQMCGEAHWVNPEERDENNLITVDCGFAVILNKWIESAKD